MLSLVFLSGCGPKHEITAIVGLKPQIDETRKYGVDWVRNILYKETEDGHSFDKIVEKLEKSGILNGAKRESQFEGCPFLLEETDAIKNRKIIKKQVFYFADEEQALIIYDLSGWVLVEINKF